MKPSSDNYGTHEHTTYQYGVSQVLSNKYDLTSSLSVTKINKLACFNYIYSRLYNTGLKWAWRGIYTEQQTPWRRKAHLPIAVVSMWLKKPRMPCIITRMQAKATYVGSRTKNAMLTSPIEIQLLRSLSRAASNWPLKHHCVRLQ